MPPSPIINQNGMVMYQAGVYGTDLVYYPITQSTLAPGARPIRNGSVRNEKNRNSINPRSGNNRNSYLGYSAGKATYGRYYSKNNLSERSPDGKGINPVELDGTGSVQDNGIVASAMYNGIPTIPSVATTSTVPVGQALPQYLPQTALPQILPTIVPCPKNADTILEEFCQANMWGAPSFHLFTAAGPDNRQLYIYKISIPAFSNLFQVIMYMCDVIQRNSR